MKHHRWRKTLFFIMRGITGPFVKFSMGYRCVRNKGPGAPAIIVANHNTDLDPALVAFGFSGHMYFVASEHALRKGFWSKVLMLLFAPIPINKTQTDPSSVKEILRRLKAGFNICVFAEGNRSYSGVTGPISVATAKLVKTSKASLITYRIEGGYFTTPRWAAYKRKGRMTGEIVGSYSSGELASLDVADIQRMMERDLYENAYERQKEDPVRYRGKNLAEHIETVLYLCPKCGRIGTIHSRGDGFSCVCGLTARYTETGFLEGDLLPFSTIVDWTAWQAGELPAIIRDAGDGPICADDRQELFLVRAASGKTFIGEGPMHIDRVALHCAGLVFPLRQIARLAIVDQMTLLFALQDGTEYEIRSAAPRSVLKYLEAFNILCGKQ